MVDFQYKDSYGVKDLEEIVRLLRAPGGCPWDAEQTHQSSAAISWRRPMRPWRPSMRAAPST